MMQIVSAVGKLRRYWNSSEDRRCLRGLDPVSAGELKWLGKFAQSDGFLQGWFMIHRVDLHKEVMRLALDPGALANPPAVIRLGAPIKAVNFDPERPSVTTVSGEEFKFDLVLGTDGIKVRTDVLLSFDVADSTILKQSTVRRLMVGAEYEPPATQFGFYRWMVDLKAHPGLLWLRDERKTSGPTSIFGGAKVMGMFAYPIRGGNLINISVAYHDTRDQDAVGTWPQNLGFLSRTEELINGRLE
jgi:salicylate hydroxylase